MGCGDGNKERFWHALQARTVFYPQYLAGAQGMTEWLLGSCRASLRGPRDPEGQWRGRELCEEGSMGFLRRAKTASPVWPTPKMSPAPQVS